ncbi:hypothetical protein BV20DRAFT_1056930 [Pilatotrama ljubarskyi]|nr:hypothetical protein BV20DRAFT_1056930 [Pilatotrama ljubarskyi]
MSGLLSRHLEITIARGVYLKEVKLYGWYASPASPVEDDNRGHSPGHGVWRCTDNIDIDPLQSVCSRDRSPADRLPDPTPVTSPASQAVSHAEVLDEGMGITQASISSPQAPRDGNNRDVAISPVTTARGQGRDRVVGSNSPETKAVLEESEASAVGSARPRMSMAHLAATVTIQIDPANAKIAAIIASCSGIVSRAITARVRVCFFVLCGLAILWATASTRKWFRASEPIPVSEHPIWDWAVQQE